MFPEIEEIRRKRRRLGISQKKLAELVGVSQPLIARLESGTFDPKLSLLKKIQKVLEEFEGRKVEAKDVMNKPVISISPRESIRKTVEIMMEKDISQLPVIEGEKVVGSITENDILRAVMEIGANAENLMVKDVMGEPFPAVDVEESLGVISKLLYEYPAVLVVEEGKIVGIITKQDVMKFLTR